MRHVKFTSSTEHRAIDIPTIEAWDDFAQSIASSLRSGDILALSGDLGAGKTTFVQALARAFGVVKTPQSPTFSLMRSYQLPKPINGISRLIHVDAYRLEHERELIVLDLDEELADAKSVLVVEWPEKIAGWLKTHKVHTISLSI